MKALVQKALSAAEAGYVEIRLRHGSGTAVYYLGRELEHIGESTGASGSVRALVHGGWGFVSFNDIERLPERVARACRLARLVGGEPFSLAPIPAKTDSVKTPVKVDPGTVSLEEKEALCRRYNDLLLQPEAIQTSTVQYRDSRVREIFATSEGAYLEQEVVFTGVAVSALARDGMNVQRAFETAGDLRGYETVQGLEAQCEETTRRAIDLLSAQPVTAGTYTIVMDPELTGVFAHEAFGHLSEADFVSENPHFQQIMTLGRPFGVDALAIVDDPTLEGEAGSYAYDAEGTPAGRTYLIRDGVLSGRLHSRETAGRMAEDPTGNARVMGCHHKPLVRMSNTFIEPRDVRFEEMIGSVQNGLYAKAFLGGQTDLEMFTFSPAEAFAIRDGQIAERVRDVVLTGNVFETLRKIDAIGDDFKLHGGLGGCGKEGQGPLRVADGGPHIRVRNVTVGGRAS